MGIVYNVETMLNSPVANRFKFTRPFLWPVVFNVTRSLRSVCRKFYIKLRFLAMTVNDTSFTHIFSISLILKYPQLWLSTKLRGWAARRSVVLTTWDQRLYNEVVMVPGSLASVTELLHYTISEVPGLVSLQHYSHSRIRQMVVESERNGDWRCCCCWI